MKNKFQCSRSWGALKGGEPMQYKEALVNLVVLKQHKDKHGDDEYYRSQKDEAWQIAFKALGYAAPQPEADTGMSKESLIDIPPYQAIDILLGIPEKAASEPIQGFTVTYADIGCIGHFTDEEKMNAAIASTKSKYDPQIFKSWIHTEGNRKHWSPR